VSARFTPETGHALAIGGHEGRRGRGHSFDRVLVRGHPLAWLDYGRLPRFHPADLNVSYPTLSAKDLKIFNGCASGDRASLQIAPTRPKRRWSRGATHGQRCGAGRAT
jgi:hypothetical protein